MNTAIVMCYLEMQCLQHCFKCQSPCMLYLVTPQEPVHWVLEHVSWPTTTEKKKRGEHFSLNSLPRLNSLFEFFCHRQLWETRLENLKPLPHFMQPDHSFSWNIAARGAEGRGGCATQFLCNREVARGWVQELKFMGVSKSLVHTFRKTFLVSRL